MSTGQPSKTVLVVDDDADVRDAHALYLEFHDFNILTAENGLAAHQVLAQHHVDLILSDIRMPVEDGYTFCQKVRTSEEKYGQIPFMFVSALTSLEEKIRGYSVGADDYVTKPVEPDELIIKIDYLISLYGKRDHINRQILCSNCMQPEQVAVISACLQRFTASIPEYDDMDTVMQALYDRVKPLGLRAVFQAESAGKSRYYSDTDVSSPLERNLMHMARRSAHYYQYGTTSIISNPRASVLFNGLWYDSQHKPQLAEPLEALVSALEQAYFRFAQTA